MQISPKGHLKPKREPHHLVGIITLITAAIAGTISFVALDNLQLEPFKLILHGVATPLIIIIMGMHSSWKERIPWAIFYTIACLMMISLSYLFLGKLDIGEWQLSVPQL
jgi:hypothetical protein